MKINLRIIAVGVMVLLTGGCTQAFRDSKAEELARTVEIITYQNDESMKKVYELQNDDMIHLFIRPDSKFVVSLPDEDSDYSWNMVQEETQCVEYYDTSWVMSEGEQYSEKDQENRRQNLFFKANNLGDDTIKIEYKNEEEDNICFNFDIRVQVEELQMTF